MYGMPRTGKCQPVPDDCILGGSAIPGLFVLNRATIVPAQRLAPQIPQHPSVKRAGGFSTQVNVYAYCR